MIKCGPYLDGTAFLMIADPVSARALRNGFVGLSIKWDRKARQPGRLSFHLMPMAVFVLGICEELILFTTVKRVWYVCCGKTRKQTECDGRLHRPHSVRYH